MAQEFSKSGYLLLPDKYEHQTYRNGKTYRLKMDVREKLVSTSLIKINLLNTRNKFLSKFMTDVLKDRLPSFRPGLLNTNLDIWQLQPRRIQKLTRRKVKSIRNIWVLSSLSKVPFSRIEAALPNFRRIGENKSYYRPVFWTNYYNQGELSEIKAPILMPSSCEVLILDEIHSGLELHLLLAKTIKQVEEIQVAIVDAKV